MPDLLPRSAGAAGPTGTNPALVNTFWDVALSWEVAARGVRSYFRVRKRQADFDLNDM